MDREAIEALDKGNRDIIRYLVNRIRRIRKCVDSSIIARVIQGDSKTVEMALRALLLCNWEGPIVRFMDENQQRKLMKNEMIFKDFII